MPYGALGGSSGSGATNALGRAASARKTTHHKKQKHDTGGGFLGTGIGPDLHLNLGVNQVLKDIAGMPGGLYRGLAKPLVSIPVAAATGGDVGKAFEPLGEFGAGMTASLAGTVGDLADWGTLAPARGVIGRAIGVKELGAQPGDLVRNAYNEGVRALVPGTQYDDLAVKTYGAKSFDQRYKERGLLSPALETVGNVALGAGAVEGGAGIAGRALEGTEAGTAAVRVSEAAHPWTTPLKESYAKTVRPFTRGAMQAEEAATGVERPVSGYTRDLPDAPKRAEFVAQMPESIQRSLRWLEAHSETRDFRREYGDMRRLGTSERHVEIRGDHNAALAEARDLIRQEARAQGVKIGLREAGDMAAEQANAQIRGIDKFVADAQARAAAKAESPEAAAAAAAIDVQQAAADIGLRGHSRLPHELMTENVKAAIDRVETEYRLAEARDARAKATQVRLGNKGLEQMGTDDVRLTRGQERLNRQALKLANRAKEWRDRVPVHMDAAYKRLAKAEAGLLAMDDSISELGSRRNHLALELDDLRKFGNETDKAKTARQLSRQTAAGAVETSAAALKRGEDVAYKVREIEDLTKQIAAKQRALTEATTNTEALRQVFIEREVPAALKAAYYDGRRIRTLEKLTESVDATSTQNWPRRYQDLGRAAERMRDLTALYPELEPIVAEMPEGFSAVLDRIQELGLDPGYLGDMTENQVKQAVYGNLRLFGRKAGQEVEGAFRKVNRGAQSSAGAVSRGAESLTAGFINTIVEKRANMLVDYIDQHMARPIEAGTTYDPKVWTPWDPVRQGLLVGEMPDGTAVAGQNVQHLIPRQLADTLKAQSRDFNHGVWKSINKVTSAWRAFVLTLSPRWYVNNTFGNAVLTTAETGVDLKAWHQAWQDFRAKNHGYRWQDSPGVAGHSMVSDLGDPTILPKEPGRLSAVDAWRDGDTIGNKIKSTKAAIGHGMRRANEAVDEFARSTVYWHSIGKGMTAEQALIRSYKALIDYGDLSPFEQTVVRSVVPFYSWQKGILKVVAQVPVDHPIAMAITMRLGDMFQQHVSETMFNGGDTPTAYAGLLGLPGGGAINPRGSNPFQDSASLVTVDGLAGSLNPFVEVFARKALGAPEGGFTDQYRMDPYGLAIPDTNAQKSLVEDVAGTVPIAQLVESATGTGRVKAGPLQQTARFGGIPAMTPGDVQRARERAANAAYMVKHQVPKPKKRKPTRPTFGALR